MVELQGCFGLIVGSASQVIPQLDNFAGNNLNFETERLRLRPFEDADFDLALPFYGDPDFLIAMEGKSPDEPVTAAAISDVPARLWQDRASCLQ